VYILKVYSENSRTQTQAHGLTTKSLFCNTPQIILARISQPQNDFQ